MFLVCHVISQDHVIMSSLVTIGSVVVHTFLMVEEQDSTCSGLNLPLLFIPQPHGMKAHYMSY